MLAFLRSTWPAFLSGLLLTLAFPPWDVTGLAWIALLPIAFYILVSKPSLAESARLGYIFGLTHFLTVFYWLTEVTWLGWCFLCLYLSLYPMLWAVVWRVLVVNKNDEFYLTHSVHNRWSVALAGTTAWVALEWIRSWFLSGFGWNTLAISLAKSPALIQIADLGGIWLVSVPVAFTGLLFATLLYTARKSWESKKFFEFRTELYTWLFVICAFFFYGIWRIQYPPEVKTSFRYLAIQPAIPQDPWKKAPLNEVLTVLYNLTKEGWKASGAEKPDIILWPETPVSASIFQEPEYQSLVRYFLENYQRPLELGSIDYAGDAVFNSAAFFQNNLKNPQIYHKQHLVIMGEYVPLANWFPLLRRFVPIGVDFSTGPGPVLFSLPKPALKLAPLICFEDTVPSLVRRAAMKNPDVFINHTNDGWFHTAPTALQHLRNSLFRAIEFRKPMVRVTNTGITAVIDERGFPLKVFQGAESIHDRGFLVGEVPIRDYSPTFYTRWGDWFPLLCVAWTCLALLQAWAMGKIPKSLFRIFLIKESKRNKSYGK